MNMAQDIYSKGDQIGDEYVVHDILGKGGFGVVYVARDKRTRELIALKTFRDEFLADPRTRNAFQKEALLWVRLDNHPFILEARWVKIFSGRLFVAMEYVEPDAGGRVNLHEHLQGGKPFSVERTVEWAVQFCLGMEHANSHGIKCHRDIKPSNILISHGVLKITDFGLAAADVPRVGVANSGRSSVTSSGGNGFGFSMLETEGGMRCGTPGYMPPEIFRGEPADLRSDIYSFGLVLWQMATGSASPPFIGVFRGDIQAFMRDAYEQQMKGHMCRIPGPLGSVIECCLSPRPANRYSSFVEVRGALEPLLQKLIGALITVHSTDGQSLGFWNNKGISLAALGRHGEAIPCYDRALAIDPRDAKVWCNKGVALAALGRHEQALDSYTSALAIDNRLAGLWANKGMSHIARGQREEAIRCYDKALATDPRDAIIWNNMGSALLDLGRSEEATGCFDTAVGIDPRYAEAWNNKGNSLGALGRCEEANTCFEKALTINPLYAEAWYNKGLALVAQGQRRGGIECFDTALEIAPQDATVWFAKGNALDGLGQRVEAIGCFDRALAVDPKFVEAWNNKGGCLIELKRHREAIGCYDNALAIAPQNAKYWFNKAYSEEQIGNATAAVRTYGKFLEMAADQHAGQVAYARNRINELK